MELIIDKKEAEKSREFVMKILGKLNFDNPGHRNYMLSIEGIIFSERFMITKCDGEQKWQKKT